MMRLRMLDRIVSLEPGARISAEKLLRRDEEYLKDHFPHFPVMPGVLMLEALFQAAMWLVRVTEDFEHSIVWLKEVRNIKYAGFVEPGQVLRVSGELSKFEDNIAVVKCHGCVEDTVVVSGRLFLQLHNMGDQSDSERPRDWFTVNQLRTEFEGLCDVDALSAPT